MINVNFYREQVKKLLADCPTCTDNERIDALFSGDRTTKDKRQTSIIKAMLLIKEFHGSDSPLYRLLDDNFHQVEHAPVEMALSLLLEHLDTFYPYHSSL